MIFGSIGTHDSYHPLAEYWNGKTWADQPVSGASAGPSPAGDLNAVSCESASACEAVGRALVMGWNGSKWVAQSAASKAAGYLTGVSCYSDGCTLVGSAGHQTVAETWERQHLGIAEPGGHR